MEVSVDEMFQTFAVLLKLKHRSDILRSSKSTFSGEENIP